MLRRPAMHQSGDNKLPAKRGSKKVTPRRRGVLVSVDRSNVFVYSEDGTALSITLG